MTYRNTLVLYDSHTHLDQYPEEEAQGLLQRAREAGVTRIITAGTTLESSAACVKLAERFHEVYAAVGVHPMDIKEPWSQQIAERLKGLAGSNPKVVAISEIGLDFQRGMPDRQLQERYLREQIQIAKELQMPIIYHSREAYPYILDILEEEGAQDVGAIAHYFQGDLSIAKRCTEMGIYISLAKPLLRLPALQTVARELPLEYIVLETDSFPQPWKRYRKNWTEPAHVRQVAEKLAQLKDLSLEEVGRKTSENLERVLGERFTAGDPKGQTWK